MNKIVLAGGCFWGLEKFFDQFQNEGISCQVGYANGGAGPVSYQQVCAGSGHAEAVEIEYPDSVTLQQLLAALFAVVDLSSKNKQGNDVGIQYRSGIYCTTKEQLDIAQNMVDIVRKLHEGPVYIDVEMLEDFCPAEEYHQKYLDKNPYGYCHLPRQILTGHRLPTVQETEAAYPGCYPSAKD